jgi:hypothetical protein
VLDARLITIQGRYQEVTSNGNTVGQIVFDTIEICSSSVAALAVLAFIA